MILARPTWLRKLFDTLLENERALLRQRFGVDPETNAKLEEIGIKFGFSRKRVRRLEGKVLVALYRWEYRKHLLPNVQRRLVQRIATARDEILRFLCDAPPIRPVLVGWHDQLVDGRRNAGGIAEPPDSLDPDDPEDTPETVLAAKIRKTLWAVARARKPARQQDDKTTGREDERDKALSSLRDLHLNAQSLLAIAEALLGHARRIEVESDETFPQLFAPVIDPDAPLPPEIPPDPPSRFQREPPNIAAMDPALSESITEEAGMPVAELWARAGGVDRALTKALRNQRLLAVSCMPLAAEIAVEQGLRGKNFFDAIEEGRAAVQELVDRFCFTADGNFTGQVEYAIHAALDTGEPDNDE